MDKNNDTSRLPKFEIDQGLQPEIKKENTDNKNGTTPVKVGVGGLFLTKPESRGKECVLLYKRYKDPENNQWSLPGGHVDLFLTCEDALKQKTVKILHNLINERDIEILDIVTAVNHFDKEKGFHYVSPQYYMNIKKTIFDSIPIVNTIENKKGSIVLLNTKAKLKKTMENNYSTFSSVEVPWLALVPIDVIENLSTKELEDIFIHTTVEAILQHLHFLNNIKNIQNTTKDSIKRMQDVLKQNEKSIFLTTKSYKNWQSN